MIKAMIHCRNVKDTTAPVPTRRVRVGTNRPRPPAGARAMTHWTTQPRRPCGGGGRDTTTTTFARVLVLLLSLVITGCPPPSARSGSTDHAEFSAVHAWTTTTLTTTTTPDRRPSPSSSSSSSSPSALRSPPSPSEQPSSLAPALSSSPMRVGDRRTHLRTALQLVTLLTTAATTTTALPRSTWAASNVETTTITPSSRRRYDISEDARQGTAALAEMDADAPVPRSAYRTLPSGVVYADVRAGASSDAGIVVHEGSRVNLQWVLRKSNGYFVDSSEVQGGVPFIFTVGNGRDQDAAIAGVDEGVRGMSVGGVRRLLIPPALAYVEGLEDGKPGPLPQGFGPRQQMRRVQTVRKDVPGEYIYLEVQVTRIR